MADHYRKLLRQYGKDRREAVNDEQRRSADRHIEQVTIALETVERILGEWE